MKDVVSCDKLRGAANKRRSGDFRMGKPTRGHAWVSLAESIGQWKATQGSEPSQYLQEKKTTVIPLVAASERGHSPNHRACTVGL